MVVASLVGVVEVVRGAEGGEGGGGKREGDTAQRRATLRAREAVERKEGRRGVTPGWSKTTGSETVSFVRVPLPLCGPELRRVKGLSNL